MSVDNEKAGKNVGETNRDITELNESTPLGVEATQMPQDVEGLERRIELLEGMLAAVLSYRFDPPEEIVKSWTEQMQSMRKRVPQRGGSRAG